MSLLVSPETLRERRAVVAGPLGRLATSLRLDLGPVLAACTDPPWLPPEKAQLTRTGGVCGRDGARLLFDPFSPRAHVCPQCGAVHTGDVHYRWWIMGYQLWLAERAVHAATLCAVGADGLSEPGPADPLGAFAAGVLSACADAYLRYPNADNVLGPTRPFFSTYLESLWLLHICVALDLLESVGAAPSDLGDRVRDRLVAPSAALIASFDEGWSNRQAWHVAARLAAARLLGHARDAEDAVHGAHGLLALLDRAMLADGTWYEGENYHQFAHRGLWYALTIAERAFGALPDAPRQRFALGFGAPLRVALPDLSLPARRDSQYGVSLRQWRWAEWCELGLTHAPGSDALAGTLAALYAPGPPRRDVGRWRATGESERNEPAAALSRADLGWKSLLFARPTLPDTTPTTPVTVLEDRQGFAVFRRDLGRLWVGVDYGASGGGHGHADRLNLTLADGDVRWLDDMGTGTYVERALHWYRSTLAHQAPLADGASQVRHDGELLAFDEVSDANLGWIHATARAGPHVTAQRAVVVCDSYVLDVLRWTASRETTVDLPIHVDGLLDGIGPFAAADPGGAGGLEDGFDFLRDVAAAACPPGAWVQLRATAPARETAIGDDVLAEHATPALTGWIHADAATTWFRAVAPGPPGTGDRRFHIVRQHGSTGSVACVWDLRRAVSRVSRSGDTIVVRRSDGGTDQHARSGDGWQVTRSSATPGIGAHALRLGGAVRTVAAPADRPGGPPPPISPHADEITLRRDDPAHVWTLGRDAYVRSEAEWDEAERPAARVSVAIDDDVLQIEVDAHLGREPLFAPADAMNMLDNERADVNSDGVQLLVVPADADATALTWLLVPQLEPSVRVTPTTPAAAAVALAATWRTRRGGFVITCTLPRVAVVPSRGAEAMFRLDVAVNERPPGRDRRRGQLLLSGADGGRVYLRGDRMDAARALVIRLPRP